jgi:hypothetical protein
MKGNGLVLILLLVAAGIIVLTCGIWFYNALRFHALPQMQNPISKIVSSTNTQSEGCALIPYVGTTSLDQLPSYDSGDEDFRGGMTCTFVINPNLPAFTFRFAGNADNSLGNIDVTEGTSAAVIQTIENSTDPGDIAPATSQDVLVPVDANFDGYKDLRILNECGATGNCSYDFYLYDPATNRFVENSFLSNLSTPTFDEAKKQVTTDQNSSAADWESDTYQYENGKYVLVKEEISVWDRKTDMVTVTTSELQDGKMEIVDATTTPFSSM